MSAMTEFPEVWDLDSLVPSLESPEFQARFDAARSTLQELVAAAETLPALSTDGSVRTRWTDFWDAFCAASAEVVELDHAVGCYCAADANNTVFQQWEARMASLGPYREAIHTAIEFGLQSISDEDLAEALAATPRLAEVAFAVHEARNRARLRLPKEQELLAAELDVDGIHAWGRLYDRISGALRVHVMQRGELVEQSISQLQLDVPDRSVRENHFHAANKAWAEIQDTCADCLNHISGTRLAKYKRLGLDDHLVAPLVYNRMERSTLDAMWSAIAARKSMLVEFLSAKARLQGLEKLAWYDVAAPLPTLPTESASGDFSWQQGCSRILETFRSFSPEFGDFAEMAFRERWVEAANRPGKRQGGFCTGFPKRQQSRIFMTYTGTADSMSTLAHELGHAYHSWVLRDQPYELRSYPMNLAETASTFAEAVLGDQRLEMASSNRERLSILDTMLSDSVAFLMNIHARFLFEDAFHQERAGGELTAERLSELMLQSQHAAYAGALADDGWNPLFWASKLHFYISTLPFYNFPYTFGYLLSLALYSMKDEIGAEFPERYRAFLVATGNQRTEAAIESSFGKDVSQPAFWDDSLNIVEQRIQQFIEYAQS